MTSQRGYVQECFLWLFNSAPCFSLLKHRHLTVNFLYVPMLSWILTLKELCKDFVIYCRKWIQNNLRLNVSFQAPNTAAEKKLFCETFTRAAFFSSVNVYLHIFYYFTYPFLFVFFNLGTEEGSFVCKETF